MESIRFIPEFLNDRDAHILVYRASELPLEDVGSARRACFLGDRDVVPYHYSHQAHAHNPWPVWLKDVRIRLRAVTGIQFTGCLVNFFSDGRNAMGFHSDIEETLAETTPVAVLSCGGVRHLSFKNRDGSKTFRLPMFSGSLLVMNEDMRQLWQHGVEKDTESNLNRVSYTFRVMKIAEPPEPEAA